MPAPKAKTLFSTSGVYLSLKDNNNWLKPALINKGSVNDKAIALSPDGLTLFLYHEDASGNETSTEAILIILNGRLRKN